MSAASERKNTINFKNGSVVKLKESTSPTAYEVTGILADGEEVIGSYEGIRDYVVFTNKRLIAVNVQGITGKKKEFTSIPYSKVETFSIETAGAGDKDSELDLWIAGIGKVHFDFAKCTNIAAIGKSVSNCIL